MSAGAWWVVVPMKDTRAAKSRLGGSPDDRRQLAILMARDTLSAIVGAAFVEGVVVVCQHEDDIESFALPGVSVVVRPGLDMNQAIVEGARLVREQRPGADVAVLPGDLPFLRSSEVEVALAAAGGVSRAVVGDRSARGTTLLTARCGHDLNPRYGPDSLARHREAGATELSLPTWSGIRRDVDLDRDLGRTPALGRRTRALLERRRPMLQEAR